GVQLRGDAARAGGARTGGRGTGVTAAPATAAARRLLERTLGTQLLEMSVAAPQAAAVGSRALSMVGSSVALIFSKVATMGFGFFFWLAAAALHRLGVVDGPAFATVFLVTTVLGTAGVLLDQVSTSLRRGDQALTRGVVFGVGAVAVVGLLAVATSAASAFAIFSAWIVGSGAMCVLGAVQLRRSLRYVYRPRLD